MQSHFHGKAIARRRVHSGKASKIAAPSPRVITPSSAFCSGKFGCLSRSASSMFFVRCQPWERNAKHRRVADDLAIDPEDRTCNAQFTTPDHFQLNPEITVSSGLRSF